VSTFPADNGLRVLSFSLFLTKLAIDHLIKTERDPARLVFVGARIAELGMYSFQDPNTGASLPDYLGASKEIGYFFTPPEVAMLIARAAIGDRKKIDHVLDPAAGTGSLLAATMLVAAERKANIAAVTGIEADKFTAKLANRLLSQQRKLLGIECKLRIENGDAIQLLNDQTRPVTSDCIVMNPPYGRVKFLRSSLTNAETRITARHVELDELAKQRQAKAASQASTFRSLSAELGLGAGPQDYQRVFTGLALKVLTVSGRLAIITPSSWLGDRDALQLRKQVLGKKLLREVILFPEDSGLFATVNQPTAIAVFEKSPGQESFSVEMLEGRTLKVGDAYDVAYKSIDKHDPAMMRVPRLSGRLYHILEKLQDFPRIQDLTEIRNARGELDLTLGKEWIQAAESSLRLIRGDHLERYVLRPASYSKQPSYINLARFEDSVIGAKVSDTYKHRLAGRQCSYLKKGRRLSFAWVPPRAILGNSCNYLCSRSDTERTPRLEAILTILNSSVVEWYFRTFNSNNHVANYEIDDLPVCLDNALTENALARASEFLTNEYCSLSDGGRVPLPIEDVADALVAFGFGLTGEETSLVLKAVRPEASLRVTNMVEALHRDGIGAQFTAGQGWYQHESPALSKLDRDVIHFVPQGGNWQSVPESIPSKRLEQIREMTAERGVVRTTYYGRLRPDQPSYTIATYFNRPGNGTNIHPWEDRTLTSREAARLQSFEDSYVFLGTATSARKQIGNAVPSLLAEAIGAQLSPRTRSHDAIELFCGAGGLSLGLERAGWKMLAAIDNDKHALQTYGFNRPSEARPTNRDTHTLVIPADLHDKEVRQQCLSAIRTKLSGGTPALLAGGPPCQGFSHAGWRLEGDKRNDLAVVFMSFVKELQPEVVLLENVEGLLSYDGGKVLQDLLLTFRDLGYDTGTSPWVLSAEQFGVPQMRRRVFLVGLRNGRSSISPPPPRFMKCLGRRELQDAPNLLQEAPYPITAAEALYDLLPLGPRVHTSMGLRRVRPYYAQWCRGEIDTKQLVELSAAEPLEADRVSHSSLEDPLELSA
jgi:Alw26I/Eco31I/Esp3I family type II restriction m6 adenine DNA methyltransferase